MFGEYKLVAYVAIALMLLAGTVTAVLSYNHAITKVAEQEDQLKLRDATIESQLSIITSQQQQAEEQAKYFKAVNEGRIAAENRLRSILSLRSKRDADGKIAADDPILAGLNSMFTNTESNKSPNDSPADARVSKSSDAAR